MPVLVDSNVILDVATEDAAWFEWSASRFAELVDETTLVINALIYAEVSVRYQTVEEVEDVLAPRSFRREPLPFEAASSAGKAFRTYRRRGGTRRSPIVEAQDLSERAEETGKVRVGYVDSPPDGFVAADGRRTGEAPEIARLILSRMGIKEIEGVLTKLASLISDLKAGSLRASLARAGMSR